jgi:hypothetical protein
MRHFLKISFEIFLKICETLIQLLTILIFIKFKYIRNFKSKKDLTKLIILGNGPSLEKSLNEIIESKDTDSTDVLCVNGFASSEYYSKIKPNYYVLTDPAFFNNSFEIERIISLRTTLEQSLLCKTNWKLDVYVPRYYLKSEFVIKIKENKNISIKPYNNVPLRGGWDRLKLLFFSMNLGNPVMQNVLITSIFIGIKKKYKNISLYGADHSWTKDLNVLENNTITLQDKHISFDKKNSDIILTDEVGVPTKLHEFLYPVATMFKEYNVLRKYADKEKVNILNMTKNSFIDAFEKK